MIQEGLVSCQELVVAALTDAPYMEPFSKNIRKVFAKKGDNCEAFTKDELLNMWYHEGGEELTQKVVNLLITEYDRDNNARISCSGNSNLGNT